MTNAELRAHFEEIFECAVNWVSADADNPETPDKWEEAREALLASIGATEQ